MSSDSDVPSYIGKWPDCGCVVFAIVDDGTDPKWVARECAMEMRGGLVLERVTVEWVRTHPLGCDHRNKGHRIKAGRLRAIAEQPDTPGLAKS